MAKILDGNITKCSCCGAYIEYSPSDIEVKERSYGVGTYNGETYMAKLLTCPKCGRKIEVY